MKNLQHMLGQLRDILRRTEFTATRIGAAGCAIRLQAEDDLIALKWAIECLSHGPADEAYREGFSDGVRVTDERHWDYLRGNVIAGIVAGMQAPVQPSLLGDAA